MWRVSKCDSWKRDSWKCDSCALLLTCVRHDSAEPWMRHRALLGDYCHSNEPFSHSKEPFSHSKEPCKWDLSLTCVRHDSAEPDGRQAQRANVARRTATHCTTLHHTATHCTTLQHTATHCTTLQHTATHCNTLQHTATHCNTLQHAATHSAEPKGKGAQRSNVASQGRNSQKSALSSSHIVNSVASWFLRNFRTRSTAAWPRVVREILFFT